ncbi:MAG TPA: hypothetical protein VK718_12030 [Ferruginibacter sp.]|jgi:hypothetical protein|nr:hypothetical protein [Ferruginibacter sp.]
MPIKNNRELKAAILQLELEAEIKRQAMIGQFHNTCENLQPANIIKKQLSKLTDLSAIQPDAVTAAMSFGAGLLSKKIYERGSNNIFRQLLGTTLEFGVAKIVANNSDKIKSTIAVFLDQLFKAREKSDSSDQL